MARILLVEDERELADALALGLGDEWHTVDVLANGRDGLEAARSGVHDLLVLDLMLPGLGGIELCRRLRADGSALPILMLTACDAPADVVEGLDAGANDYLRKPFAFEELLARIRALLRGPSPDTSCLRAGSLCLDTAAHRVSRGGCEVELTAKEYQLLEALLLRRDRVVSREQLTESLWHWGEGPESNVIEVYVSSLRRKLERPGEPRLIETVRGLGYRIWGGPR